MALGTEVAERTFQTKGAQVQGYKAKYLWRIGTSSVGLTGRALSFSEVWALYRNGVPPKGSKSMFVFERSLWQRCENGLERLRQETFLSRPRAAVRLERRGLIRQGAEKRQNERLNTKPNMT